MPTYRSTKTAVLFVVLAVSGAGAGPARAQGPVPIKATVTIAGRTETLRGTGRCGHEPRAWLHGTAAALWLVQYADTGEGAGLSLSYWRFADADEQQFSLSVQRRKARHRISTVKDGELEGSGRAAFRPTATGGRFEISGKTQDGSALQATIECARFGGIHAEGG